MTEPLIYELSSPGRVGFTLPECDVPKSRLPEDLLRAEVLLPEVSEVDVIRHFTRLSQYNYGVDLGMYPLGSCTMKYNPKVNEEAARYPGFAQLHPYQDEATAQGALQLMFELQQYLGEIGGLPAVSLQPAAGAHGELTGMLIIWAYHLSRGETQRQKVLIPDSAHGTNPATSTMGGFQVVEVKSDARGNVDLDDLRRLADNTLVGLMLTNPNTLGLFDEHVQEVARIVHEAGGLLYGDGANLNAIVGVARPGDLGFDVLHFNLHKTFSTPHGGGGPGSGPVAVTAALADFLPTPLVRQEGNRYTLYSPPRTIGRVKSFYGNFGILVRAYTYIRLLGLAGLRATAENAVLNANYLLARTKDAYDAPYGDRYCKHEFVLSGNRQKAYGVRTLDIAKRLIDYGFHPPTVYFPLIVPECLMVEPTESESLETLDAYAAALLAIAKEAESNPELLHQAPTVSRVGRLDEVTAAREPKLRWKPG
ncbi:MAG: glycine dehydrogenase subunit 2 [Chloroflexi bacterium]|nr:glycine dehydrogenase subunit 2 [Chloroflexota bacterium]